MYICLQIIIMTSSQLSNGSNNKFIHTLLNQDNNISFKCCVQRSVFNINISLSRYKHATMFTCFHSSGNISYIYCALCSFIAYGNSNRQTINKCCQIQTNRNHKIKSQNQLIKMLRKFFVCLFYSFQTVYSPFINWP